MNKNKIALCGVMLGLIIGSTSFAISAISYFEIKNQNLIPVKGRIVSAVPHVYKLWQGSEISLGKRKKIQFQIVNRKEIGKTIDFQAPRKTGSMYYEFLKSSKVGDIMDIYIDAANPTKAYLDPQIYLHDSRSGMIVGGIIVIFTLFALRHLILYGVQ